MSQMLGCKGLVPYLNVTQAERACDFFDYTLDMERMQSKNKLSPEEKKETVPSGRSFDLLLFWLLSCGADIPSHIFELAVR